MKKIEWINGNKMKFESPHKTFNNYVTCISAGNVIGGGQTSGFVRGYEETECNGFENPKGHLQEWDLNEGFAQTLAYQVKDWIRENVRGKESVIAYKWFYYDCDILPPLK